MSSTATLASSQPSRYGMLSPAKKASKVLNTTMTCALTLGDCSLLAPATAYSAERESFCSAKERGEITSAARARMASDIHSSTSGIWRQRRPSSLTLTPPTRPSTLPPPPSALPARPAAPHQYRLPTSMANPRADHRRGSNPLLAGEDAVPLSLVSPGPVWPSTNQLKVAYTYGIQRDDGTYTQLIRADELDSYDFERVPISQAPEGMIVLPAPEQPRPERREGPELMVSKEVYIIFNRAVCGAR